MNDFQALVAGYHTDPTNSDIPKAVNENIPPLNRPAFRIGEELSRARFMVISADTVDDFQRDVAAYNAVVDKINDRFGKGTAVYFDEGDYDGLNFALVDPETGAVTHY